jgi:hypothetical protein
MATQDEAGKAGKADFNSGSDGNANSETLFEFEYSWDGDKEAVRYGSREEAEGQREKLLADGWEVSEVRVAA